MAHELRSERVVRRLALRLDELALALENAGAPPESIERLLDLASVATMHAVALELLTSERAAEVWTAAVARHPVLEAAEPPRVSIAPGTQAAA